jgi:hypothetical protein
MRRNALDRLLADMDRDFEDKIAELQGLGDAAALMLNESAQRQKIKERREAVLEAARDEDGDPINPDIEEAIDWLDNEPVSDAQDYVDGIRQIVDEGVAALQEKQKELRDIIKATPAEAFYRA